MKRLLTIIIICLSLSAAGQNGSKQPTDTIPANTTVFLSVNDFEPFLKALKNRVKSEDGTIVLQLTPAEFEVIYQLFFDAIKPAIQRWQASQKKSNK